jgi:hypothetical protein
MFDPKSRYAAVIPVLVTDARGRAVSAIPAPPAPEEAVLGVHARRQNERADHLAALYLSDPAAFWRLAEINDAMTAEVLTELRDVLIPTARGGRGRA